MHILKWKKKYLLYLVLIENKINLFYNLLLKENISDQILLWEAERNRIQYNKGVLYDSFPSGLFYLFIFLYKFLKETIFKDVVEYAQNCGVYIWHQQEKQLLMVTEEGHDFVRQFIKKKIS